jgi:dipeptidyl aminopeptidase/acylaminoacyl peptidase
MRTTVLRCLTALLPVLAAGCLPNATWLPDSSGFVYTGGKNKDALFLYDLGKKAARTLVEKGAGPAWPAVSPDGKRIAVALRHDDGTDVTLEVIVFDRDGKELQRSDASTNVKMKWAKQGVGSDQVAVQAFWVPNQDKLLLYTDGETGIYDLKTRGVTMLDVSLMTFGATPIRPDGKGFLAAPRDGAKPAFVDWDGKQHPIELTKDLSDNQNGDALGGMLFFPLMHSSRWDGSTAVVSWDDLRVKIDADKFTASLEHIKPALSDDGKVIQDQLRLPGGGVVRAVELIKRYRKDGAANDQYPFGEYRVEVVKQRAKEPNTLMEGAGYFMIYPSPDGKKAAVRCSKSMDAIFKPSNAGEDMLFVIDGQGDVTDKIDLGK